MAFSSQSRKVRHDMKAIWCLISSFVQSDKVSGWFAQRRICFRKRYGAEENLDLAVQSYKQRTLAGEADGKCLAHHPLEG